MVKAAVNLKPTRAKPIFKHSLGVSLREVMNAGERLEASAYNLETRKALAELKSGPFDLVPLYGPEGLAHEAPKPIRLKRIWVKPSRGVPFLSSSDIISLQPDPERHISLKHTKHVDLLRVKLWDVLISRFNHWECCLS